MRKLGDAMVMSVWATLVIGTILGFVMLNRADDLYTREEVSNWFLLTLVVLFLAGFVFSRRRE